MRRKNLIVTRKVEKKITIKNSKINKFYENFRSIVFKKIEAKSFAVAISGGSDSLCLAYFSKLYSAEFKSKMHALIVDHKLRKESYKEALSAKNILKRKGIKSKVIRW